MVAKVYEPMLELPEEGLPADRRLLWRLAHFLLFLAAGLVIFNLDSSYIDLFPTNNSTAFKIIVPAGFLGVALLCRRSRQARAYWPLAYACFVASAAILFAWLLIDLDDWLLARLGLALGSDAGMAVSKVAEVVLMVVPILLLSRVAGWDLGSLYLRRGRLAFGLVAGGLILMNYAVTALAVAGNTTGHLERLLPALPWMVLFAFANGFMEELWFRGLFLGRLAPFLGDNGALLLTSVVFTVAHAGALYLADAMVWLFLLLLFPLAVGFGWLMQQSRAIWGSTIFHGAADLFWFIIFGF